MNSETCELNGKGNVNVKEDSNIKGNKGRFGQAINVMIRTGKIIIGCLSGTAALTALVLFMRKTGSYWTEEGHQELEEYPDGKQEVKFIEEHVNTLRKGWNKNYSRGHGWECKAGAINLSY